ncbi:MAG: ABC transporter permease [Phycisphaerales bacterium]|nr:ABC transporter permease [Phycisphaerales bacterium]
MRLLPFRYAVRNLGRSPTRLALAVSGSAFVVLLILVAGGFVRGMTRALGATGSEHNVILLGAGSEDSVERSEILASVPGIVAASVPGIRVRAGVPYLSPEVHVMLPVSTPGPPSPDAGQAASPRRQALVRGVTHGATLVHDSVSLVEGRWPRTGQDEVLVGRMAPTVLGLPPADLAVGRSIVFGETQWTIVGTFTAPGTAVEAELWVPLTDLTTATKRETISCVVLTLDPYNPDTGEGAEVADVDAFSRTRPDLELAVIPERAYYGKLADFFGPVRAVVWVTASLVATGGLFGGLTIMYAAFASRIRELGTLQSIGYRRVALLLSMIQESTLATASGGLMACAVALLACDGLAVRFSMGAFGLVIDERVVSLGLAAGLLLGVVGAVPPAIRCLRPAISVALKAV